MSSANNFVSEVRPSHKLLGFFASKELGNIRSVKNLELKLLLYWLWRKNLSVVDVKAELIIFRSHPKQLPCDRDIRINKFKLDLHQTINTYNSSQIILKLALIFKENRAIWENFNFCS